MAQEYTGERFTLPVTDKRPFEETWLTPSAADLKPGTDLREAVEEMLAEWHSNHEENGRITGYDEWIERLEGMDIPGEPGVRMDLGSDYSAAPWTTLKSIAKKVAADLR